MSNRSSYSRQEKPNSDTNHSGNRGNYRGKTHKIFVPKNPNSPSPITKSQTTTLSSSLRHQSRAETVSSTQDRAWVRLGEGGESLSNKGNFVNYLPQDEAVAIGLDANEGGLDAIESQRVVNLLNRELARLLKLKPRDFWFEVVGDASLHEFLDSYLQFQSRWYDFPFHGTKGIVAGVIVEDLELSRRVLMVLYRISSHRDPCVRASESLTKKDHEDLLQDKKLLDLPKLLDICAVYGHENEELTRSLVVNAINAQPEIFGSFTAMVTHFSAIVHTMYQRCRASLEVLKSAGGCEDHGSSRQYVEYMEVMDFLNDAIASMDTFITAYRPAAIFLSCPVDASHGNEELINILATLHDSFLPSIQQGLQIILSSQGKTSSAMLSEVYVSSKSLSARLVDLGWKILENCYLNDELFKDNLHFPAAMKMFPASVEDPVIRADILIQCCREIDAVSQDAVGKNHRGTFLQNIDKKFQIVLRIQSLQQSGWLFVEDEQYRYLAGVMTHPVSNLSRKLPRATNSVSSVALQMQEDAAIAESEISQVKDLFPDCGKGFILACLEAYDHNPEEVIQRILEGTLHEDLKNLDTSLETLPPNPTLTVTKNDKGKGILVGSSVRLPATNSISVPQNPIPKAVSSSASSMPPLTGRFIRKARGDQHDNKALESRDVNHLEKTTALLSQYEYEDEYDDSFDDLGMTVLESSVEETETLGESFRSHISISSRDESQSSGQSTTKWGSRRKPQFYVKDGKNYSYKVEGSIAVTDEHQALIIMQAQKEIIHGLGRGGNCPLGAVKRWEERNEVEEDESNPSDMDGGETGGRGRGRGRGGRRVGGGGRNSHYRKDRAMKKHMAGVGGF